jgi:putative Holliday junction resolvase
VVALDLGERRIGVAATDELGMAAHPLPYIPKGRARAEDLARIAEVVRARGATLVIVGHPIGLRGQSGPAARRVEQFVEALRAVLSVPCVLRDERYTTVEAERLLLERGLRREERRQRVDSAAAAVLLEGWLEEQRK